MRRTMRFAIGVLLAAAASLAFLAQAQAPQVPSGTWAPGGTMSRPRTGASAALVPDGRVLITGGMGATGPTATAELFNPTGIFTAAAPMNVARTRHSSIALRDGRVLVAGGITANGGATRRAEVYDAASGLWT